MSITTSQASLLDASIVDVNWRVDVVLTSLNDVEHVAVPVVVLGIRWSNGIVLTYRLKQEELHQWRFSLAKSVRDLLYLEKKRPPEQTKRTARK